jgi:TatD DNase family protein
MFVDAHTHLEIYGDRIDAALENIEATRIITVSMALDLPTYQENVALAARSPWVIPALGVHPACAHEWVDRLDELSDLLPDAPLIGEIGLDKYFVKEQEHYPAQREVFEFFLAAARQHGKIVNLHSKGAEEDVIATLARFQLPRVIVHWYSGPLAQFRQLRDLGVYFTVGSEVEVSEHVQRIAREVPEDRLLTETDGPGVHEWLFERPGLPDCVRRVVDRLAELRDTTPDAIQATVLANFRRLLADDPALLAQVDALAGPD